MLAAAVAAAAGVIVILLPRLAPGALAVLLALMAFDPDAHHQGTYLFLIYAVAAYTTRLRGFVAIAVAVLVWQVAWFATVASEPRTNLASYLAATVLYPLPGLFLRHVEWRAARLDEQLAASREEIALAAARERQSLARELHDAVAHELTIIAMQARVAERTADEAARLETVHLIGDHARGAMVELRRLLQVLRANDSVGTGAPGPGTGALDEAALGATLSSIEDRLRGVGMQPHVVVDGDLDAVPSGLRPTISALVREGATNAIKHGGPPRRCDIRITSRAADVRAELTVEIRNEVASTREFPESGFGLSGLAERVTGLGGSFDTAFEGSEFVLRARIPMGV